jgi:hypothetical protein
MGLAYMKIDFNTKLEKKTFELENVYTLHPLTNTHPQHRFRHYSKLSFASNHVQLCSVQQMWLGPPGILNQCLWQRSLPYKIVIVFGIE